MPSPLPTHFECINPILRVENMAASVRYYVDVLGFENAEWGTDDFTHVGREGKGIYLCRGGQGHAGAWVWIGVGDVRALHDGVQGPGCGHPAGAEERAVGPRDADRRPGRQRPAVRLRSGGGGVA